MSDSVKIIYNGIDAFNPQPTPFIAVEEQSIYYGELWGKLENFTLRGTLTGCSFDYIVDAQKTLLSNFNKSYQNLEIWQEENSVSGLVYSKELVEVNSIQFDQSNWFGALPYTINLSCYPRNLFSGAYGILNPTDNWNFEENENATLNAIHTISCQPFNTSSDQNNAIVNAQNWAFGKTGINSFVSPIFISGVSLENFCLLSQSENIDRFNGTYSLTEVYTNDLARTGYGVIRYSANVESGNNIITVNLDGTAQGCNQNITGTRYAFNRLDKTAIALKAYQRAFNQTDLNPIPIIQSFNEDPFSALINFNYSFNNDNNPPVLFDYDVSVSNETNGVVNVSIQGEVRARNGDVQSRLVQCRNYAETINLYNLTIPFYNEFGSSFGPLNPVPINSGYGESQSAGTINLSAVFSNEQKVSDVLDKFEYSMSFVPSVVKADIKPKLDGLGQYSIVNLLYKNRSSFTIQGNALVNSNFSSDLGVQTVKNKCYELFNQYTTASNIALESNEVTKNRNDEKILSFSFTWSFDSPSSVGLTSVGNISV